MKIRPFLIRADGLRFVKSYCYAPVAFILGILPATVHAAPPANDAFSKASPLTTGTAATGSNQEATTEAGEPIPDGYSAATYARTVWWTWTATTTGT